MAESKPTIIIESPSLKPEVRETSSSLTVGVIPHAAYPSPASAPSPTPKKAQLTTRGNGNSNSSSSLVHVIALTGGPCAGKSSALARIRDDLGELGYHVYTVPEAATILLSGGATIDFDDKEKFLHFEKVLVETQMSLEDRFKALAVASGVKSVVVCDRGVMDTAAYLSPELFEALLDANNWSVVQLRDRRYDGVVHMVTAAKGAEKFYTLENNKARRETVEEARKIDERLITAWLGHHNQRIVNNSTSFERKIRRTVEEICQIVGAPLPGSIERRYLLRGADLHLDVLFQEFTVTLDYLQGEDGVLRRLKKRSQGGSSQYTVSQRSFEATEASVYQKGALISESQIQSSEYVLLLEQKDPKRQTVKKIQKVFAYDGQIFTVNEYYKPSKVTVLEAHSTEGDIVIPEFLRESVVRDVSNDARYSSTELSLGPPPAAPEK